MSASQIAAPAVLLLCAGAAMAQAPTTLPDAGRLLQEEQQRRPVEPPEAAPRLKLEPPPPPTAAPGQQAPGAAITLRRVAIEGLGVVPEAQVLAELPPVEGRTFDLAQLRSLAAQAQAAVRARGLPFARAYLPQQDLNGGVLRIAVVEGRYGQVQATGDAAQDAQPWLGRLQPGAAITAGPLERSVLLLNDLPGVQAEAVLRPGSESGTGDLTVQVAGGRRLVSGEVGLDNHGNRYAGRERVRGGVDVEGAVVFGDQLSLRASYSDEGTWVGGLAYALPLGTDGWRLQLGLSRADYELGREFAALGAHGTADVASAALAYPWLRTRTTNVRGAAGIQYKRLHDERTSVGASERKRSVLLPLSLSLDHRSDRAVTWGGAALTLGRLELDPTLAAADAATARTEGRFGRLNLDLAHLQGGAARWSLFGRVSAQAASRNLDSSEKFVLGGPYGVRGWPTGEATGDEGALAQVELRYRVGSLEPFAFVDAGTIRFNHSPWAAGRNRRSINSAGVGVRWAWGPWNADASAAWRGDGGPSQSEPMAQRLRVWANVGYRF